jgi:hypothetical protein
VVVVVIVTKMTECIDLAFDHILAPVSSRKRNRENDVVDDVDNALSSKRSSSRKSRRYNRFQ